RRARAEETRVRTISRRRNRAEKTCNRLAVSSDVDRDRRDHHAAHIRRTWIRVASCVALFVVNCQEWIARKIFYASLKKVVASSAEPRCRIHLLTNPTSNVEVLNRMVSIDDRLNAI